MAIPSGDYANFMLIHVLAMYNTDEDETANLIIKLTNNINSQIPPEDATLGGTPLHICASHNNPAIASAILLTRTDVVVDSRDGHGLTPLHRAVVSGCSSVARILLKRYPELIDQIVSKDTEKSGTLAGMNLLHLTVFAAINNPRPQKEKLYHLTDAILQLSMPSIDTVLTKLFL